MTSAAALALLLCCGAILAFAQATSVAQISGTVSDPKGAATGTQRIFRGGSWINSAAWCRSGMRYRATPTARNYLIGFRVVCEP